MSRRVHIKLQSVIGLFALLAWQAADTQANTTFLLDDTAPAFADGLNNGDVVSADGIDLTFSNVVVANGGTNGDVEGTGILISATTEPGLSDVISFDFSFSEDVKILTYDVGAREDVPNGASFVVTGSNGTSGNNTIPDGTDLFNEVTLNFDAGSIPFFEAGEVYSFSHNLPSNIDALFNLEQLVVATIPEPSTICLLGLGGVFGLLRRKR